MKKLIFILLALLGLSSGGLAAEGGVAWNKFPDDKVTDMVSLQRGAKLFVNYCLNCHTASYMRYNRMRDIGLTEAQIKTNLMFASDKVGDTMSVALNAKQAKDFFGAQPPDLTVIARSRAEFGKGSGADYLYTYMRSYYRDDSTITGWNNRAFPNVGMPHVLWELQGQRGPKFAQGKDESAAPAGMESHQFVGYEQLTPGTLSSIEYDEAVADLVGFLQWMGEPSQNERVKIGVFVLVYLAIFTVIAWRMNAAFWKDVK